MGKAPESLGHSTKPDSVVSREGKPPMTDTTYARELLHDAFPVAPGRNVKAAIGQAFRALERHERRLPAERLRLAHWVSKWAGRLADWICPEQAESNFPPKTKTNPSTGEKE